MPLSETDVRRIVEDMLSNSVNWAPEFKSSLSSYMDISDFAQGLRQSVGWRNLVRSNDSVVATDDLILGPTITAIEGTDVLIYEAGTYKFDATFGLRLLSGGTVSENYGTTASNVDNAGGSSWGTPSSARTQDGNTSGNTPTPGGDTDFLRILDFQTINVPTAATIDGIEVRVRLSRASGTLTHADDLNVRLVKAGSAAGSTITVTTAPSVAAANYTFGGPTEMWGTTWTPSQVMASNFGASFWLTDTDNVFFFVDVIGIKVYATGTASNAVGYLYVDDVQQSPAITVPVEGLSEDSVMTKVGTWTVEYSAPPNADPITANLRASTDGAEGEAEIEADFTSLSVVRVK